MPVPTAIAPSALTGSPAWRVLRPAELPNTATTSTEKGENPFGLADAGVANGYIAAWTAMTGSASNASLSTATGNGLVIDDLGGLHAAALLTSDTYGGGGCYNGSAFAANLPSSRDFTLVLALNTVFNVQSTTSVDAAPEVLRPCAVTLSNAATDSFRVCINGRREWMIQTTGPTLGATENVCTHRACASTQLLVITGSATAIKVGIYTRATGAITTIGTFSAAASTTFGYWTLGIVPGGSVANSAWRGAVRGAALINDELSFTGEAPNLAEWLLQQVGEGMGDTTETKAVVYLGDSTAAGCFGFGSRSRAGYMAARARGLAVADTVGILSATAAWWVDTGTADRVATLCDFSKMFPGHTITGITVIVRLGINDAGITGAAPATAADFVDDLEELEARLIAAGVTAGIPVSVVFNTIEAAANSGGWVTPTLNATRMDLVDDFNDEIRSRFPAAQISDTALYGPGAKPASVGAWNDSILEKTTKTPSYQIPTSSAAASTRLTWDGVHQGHDGQGEAVAVDMTNTMVLARIGLGGASISPFGLGRSRGR